MLRYAVASSDERPYMYTACSSRFEDIVLMANNVGGRLAQGAASSRISTGTFASPLRLVHDLKASRCQSKSFKQSPSRL